MAYCPNQKKETGINRMRNIILCGLLLTMAGCGSSSDSISDDLGTINLLPRISSGLKIFVTAEIHHAWFGSDPGLTGANGAQRADDFCNKSASKPSLRNYKALLVDGVNRDAVALTDWVLQPNTTYYQSYDDVPIGTTNGNAIFDLAAQDLQNPVLSLFDFEHFFNFFQPEVMTGIDDATLFTTSTFDCNDWSGLIGNYANVGLARSVTTNAFHSGYVLCGPGARLYCVEQP